MRCPLPVPECPPAQQIIERLFAIAGDADAKVTGQASECPKGELHFERVAIDQENVHLIRQLDLHPTSPVPDRTRLQVGPRCATPPAANRSAAGADSPHPPPRHSSRPLA